MGRKHSPEFCPSFRGSKPDSAVPGAWLLHFVEKVEDGGIGQASGAVFQWDPRPSSPDLACPAVLTAEEQRAGRCRLVHDMSQRRLFLMKRSMCVCVGRGQGWGLPTELQVWSCSQAPLVASHGGTSATPKDQQEERCRAVAMLSAVLAWVCG